MVNVVPCYVCCCCRMILWSITKSKTATEILVPNTVIGTHIYYYVEKVVLQQNGGPPLFCQYLGYQVTNQIKKKKKIRIPTNKTFKSYLKKTAF